MPKNPAPKRLIIFIILIPKKNTYKKFVTFFFNTVCKWGRQLILLSCSMLMMTFFLEYVICQCSLSFLLFQTLQVPKAE